MADEGRAQVSSRKNFFGVSGTPSVMRDMHCTIDVGCDIRQPGECNDCVPMFESGLTPLGSRVYKSIDPERAAGTERAKRRHQGSRTRRESIRLTEDHRAGSDARLATRSGTNMAHLVQGGSPAKNQSKRTNARQEDETKSSVLSHRTFRVEQNRQVCRKSLTRTPVRRGY